MRSSQYRLALLCLFAATFFTSTAGVMVRWIESKDAWAILLWRSVFFVVIIAAWLALRYRGQLVAAFRKTGRPGLVMATAFFIATLTFIMALLETTVAKVALISGSIPFYAAFFGWLFLGERVARATIAFMVVAFIGIVVMIGADLGQGSLYGDTLALLCSLATATMYIAIRKRPGVDMVPAVLLGGALTVLLAPCFAGEFLLSAQDLLICAFLGFFQLGVQYIMVAYGTQHVPAAEASLTARMSTVLSPIWAWLGVGEIPSDATFWGGALVLAAIAGSGLWSLHASRRLAKLKSPA